MEDRVDRMGRPISSHEPSLLWHRQAWTIRKTMPGALPIRAGSPALRGVVRRLFNQEVHPDIAQIHPPSTAIPSHPRRDLSILEKNQENPQTLANSWTMSLFLNANGSRATYLTRRGKERQGD